MNRNTKLLEVIAGPPGRFANWLNRWQQPAALHILRLFFGHLYVFDQLEICCHPVG